MIYAILSMVFAGITSILAKYGLQNVSADLGLGVRTTVIFIGVMLINTYGARWREAFQLTSLQLSLLVASGVATILSWLFYYRAMKDGPVSFVAAIDKGSIVITLLLSFVLLKEPMTPKILIGGALIFAGLIVLIWK